METIRDVLRHLVSYGQARNAEEEQRLLAVIDSDTPPDPEPAPAATEEGELA